VLSFPIISEKDINFSSLLTVFKFRVKFDHLPLQFFLIFIIG